jgi:nicotinamidase-related amidase
MEIGSEDWQIVPQLTPADDEAKVGKLYRNSFEATTLEEVLAGLGVGHLYVCGAQTNNCVRYTTHGALERGYDVTLLSDAHTTTDFDFGDMKISAAVAVDELNSSLYGEELPGRKGVAMKVEEAFALV